MPITLGMASSHFPSLFQDSFAGWQRYFEVISGGIPQPIETFRQDEACVADWIMRRDRAFARLQAATAQAAPAAMIVVAGDQDEWFSPANLPNVMIYSGEAGIDGFHNYGDFDADPPLRFWEDAGRFGVHIETATELAAHLQRTLVAQDFDVAISRAINPQGRPERRAPHALTRPLPLIMPKLDIPVVPIIVKTIERSKAVLSGERCLALGRAIGEICAAWPEPIAIYGSGGMSHDPSGPLSGWVDEPLDRWVLRCLEEGDLDALQSLFLFRSAATDSGTGELRTWLVTAGAMAAVQARHRCEIVDYFPAHIATAGCGWVLWDEHAKGVAGYRT
ncbi:hypothetical protein HZF05_05630 [Sphingomonas sp. CGMCC 1.13654]|uniref:Extradiol ring-cleavage dioxygenase class III enzyme subunit B domain-containing protein n=1 Tax=Sphingomonas chungangi TaxID=2683589 RepID=A0A838L247_9SPHN|nr:hypothetical protein [Sphingomonas chungangi]MBA2933573.1 hypothetical protein [Sphingomonas chungangi]MVW54906.1 hypothetical protein [Sphingomonas chungangi]